MKSKDMSNFLMKHFEILNVAKNKLQATSLCKKLAIKLLDLGENAIAFTVTNKKEQTEERMMMTFIKGKDYEIVDSIQGLHSEYGDAIFEYLEAFPEYIENKRSQEKEDNKNEMSDTESIE